MHTHLERGDCVQVKRRLTYLKTQPIKIKTLLEHLEGKFIEF